MKIFSEIKDINLDNLEQFVYGHPNGNFFQSTKAYHFFQSVENYEPILLVAQEGEEIIGSLLAVIIKEPGIKSYFSRRCIVWGGPLVKDDYPDVVHGLLQKLNEMVSSKAIYTEFRNLFDLSTFQKIFGENDFAFVERLNFIINLINSDENFKKLNKTRRWEIRKSIKEGVSIFEANNLDEVRQFYLLLKNLYKRKVKRPLPSFSFFKNFYLNPDLGKYFLLKFEGKIVGGTMCSIFKDRIYEWYECGLDKEYKNIYPSSLATWAPIEYAAKNGLKYFDFMGAGKPDDDYGVREFKSKFGGKLVNYGRFLRINNPFLFNLGKLGLKMMKWLK